MKYKDWLDVWFANYIEPSSKTKTCERYSDINKRLDKEKKPYVYVGLVCVRGQFQGQGYMRKLMDVALAEGNRLKIPVILDTDAKSKRDKYVHLGIELVDTRRFGEYRVMYDLIKYPD